LNYPQPPPTDPAVRQNAPQKEGLWKPKI